MRGELPVIDRHQCYMSAKFVVVVDVYHSKLPTLYWLPFNKIPQKS